jgi:hypothetical protein
MAWGYMEVPPMLSVFSWLIKILGGSEFWIKFWPDLIGGLCFLLIGRMVMHLKGGRFALLLVFLPFLFGAYLRIFFLFQPNCIEVFFWTLIAYTLIRFLQTDNRKYIYFFGISIGLGLLSKYTVAFYTLSLLIGLLLTPQRRIFLNRYLYLAAGIAFLIFLPNLIWQYNHNFPVIYHMNELKETQLQYLDNREFITEQFMMQLPVVFVWLAGLLYLLFSPGGARYRFYGIAYLVLGVMLILLKGKAYYMLGVYPILFAFGAVWLEKLTTISWKWSRYAMIVFTLAIGAGAIPFLLPVAAPDKLSDYFEKMGVYDAGDFKWEDLKAHPLPQDYADMMGWKELANATTKAWFRLPAEKRARTFIFASNYGFAGSLNYYGKSQGLPEVYSSSASFLFWMPEKYDFDNFMLIMNSDPADNPITTLFAKATVLDSVNIPMFRENGTKIYLFEQPTDSVNQIAAKRVMADKAKFIR